ncbi:unnamed protein product [Phytomonas sp. Hart1]|nr:unnamed protein product [Phytomonas sp. Hart1]|eukprot:CCW66947.1 unnamed protein product [Phytomonas sp. isolate Hart1]
METIEYPNSILNDVERLDKLKCAACAFVVETVTRRELHVIALVVSVSPLSDALGSVRRSQNLGTCSEVSKKGKMSEYSLLKHRRKLKREAVHQCCTAAEFCLHQALRDAQMLALWLNRTFFGHARKRSGAHSNNWYECPHETSMGVEVVVMASLVPRTIPDLALFMTWQQGLEARRHSPLRYAALLRISFGNPLFIQNWECYYGRARKQGTATKSKVAAAVLELSSIVQPHQALLIDIRWCLEAATGSRNQTNMQKSVTIFGKGANHMKNEAARDAPNIALDSFFDEINSLIKLPSEGRVAMWLPYSDLLSECCTSSRCQCVTNALTSGPSYSKKSKIQYDKLHIVCDHCSNIRKLSIELGSLYRRLHEYFGQVKSWKLLTSHGGTLNGLLDKANFATMPGTEGFTRETADTAAKLYTSTAFPPNSRVREGVLATSANKPIFAFPLLSTRSLRDAYALLGVLVGHDTVGFYEEGVSFCRGIRRRLYTARVTGIISGFETVLSKACVSTANGCELVDAINNIHSKKDKNAQDFIGGDVDIAKGKNITDKEDPQSQFDRDMYLYRGKSCNTSLKISQHAPFGEKRPRQRSAAVETRKARTRML